MAKSQSMPKYKTIKNILQAKKAITIMMLIIITTKITLNLIELSKIKKLLKIIFMKNIILNI